MAVSADVLAERIEALRAEQARFREELERMDGRIGSIERFKAWLAGIGVAIGFLLGIAADFAKDVLHK